MSDIVKHNKLLTDLQELLRNSVNKSDYIREYNKSVGHPLFITIPPELMISDKSNKVMLMTMDDVTAIVQLVTEYVGKEN